MPNRGRDRPAGPRGRHRRPAPLPRTPCPGPAGSGSATPVRRPAAPRPRGRPRPPGGSAPRRRRSASATVSSHTDPERQVEREAEAVEPRTQVGRRGGGRDEHRSTLPTAPPPARPGRSAKFPLRTTDAVATSATFDRRAPVPGCRSAEPAGDPSGAELRLVGGDLGRGSVEGARRLLTGHELHVDRRDVAVAELDVADAATVVGCAGSPPLAPARRSRRPRSRPGPLRTPPPSAYRRSSRHRLRTRRGMTSRV